jgi:CheY-like chemotaxis protein
LNTSLVLLADLDEIVAFQDIPVIIMPAYAVSIANVLNRRPFEGGAAKARVKFVAPDARVLVVDDMPTNLVVAKGLLAPYGMKVDTCVSGEEAVDLVKMHSYDLVLMDHMMPGMDGIEATALIRGMAEGSGVSIVALTANAMSGMEEMFLQKGMDGFLSKPIDIGKLDAILHRWIPEEKRHAAALDAPEQNGAGADVPFEIAGVDVEKGMAMSGGTEERYRGLLKQYRRDLGARVEFLNSTFAERDLTHFIMHMHALKSASASVGAIALSEEAKALEDAGRRGDMEFIRERVEGFRARLADMGERIGAILDPGKKTADPDGNGEKPLDAEIVPILVRLQNALATEEIGVIDGLLSELSARPLNDRTAEALSCVSDLVLIAEFAEAASVIGRFMKGEISEGAL